MRIFSHLLRRFLNLNYSLSPKPKASKKRMQGGIEVEIRTPVPKVLHKKGCEWMTPVALEQAAQPCPLVLLQILNCCCHPVTFFKYALMASILLCVIVLLLFFCVIQVSRQNRSKCSRALSTSPPTIFEIKCVERATPLAQS